MADNTEDTAVFGVSLEVLAGRFASAAVPTFLKRAIKYLNSRALKEVDLFRVNAPLAATRALRVRLDDGEIINFKTERTPPNVVATLIKQWLKELPEPLLTHSLFRDFIATASISIDEHRFNELRAVMLRLPTINRSIMQLLALFLSRVSDHQRVNNMTVKVIASVIGPYILAPAEENPSTIVKTTAAILSVTESIIEQCEFVFAAAGGDAPVDPNLAALMTGSRKTKRVSVIHDQPLNFLESIAPEKDKSRSDILTEFQKSTAPEPIVKLLAFIDQGEGGYDAEEFAEILLDRNYDIYSAIYDVVPVPKCEDLISATVELFHSHGEAIGLIKWALVREIALTISQQTLFRANSIATKIMTNYSFLIGERYLKETLGAVMTLLIESEDEYEIDPKKVKSKKLKQNISNLQFITQLFLDSIFNSTSNLPFEFRVISRQLQLSVNARFPDVQHHVVGGFIFLRFICPALLSPTRWNFTAEVTSKAQRAIILISKTLQNLANGVKFSAAKPEMMEMNRFIENNASAISHFFDEVAQVPRDREGRAPIALTDVRRVSLLNTILRKLTKHREGFEDYLEGLAEVGGGVAVRAASGSAVASGDGGEGGSGVDGPGGEPATMRMFGVPLAEFAALEGPPKSQIPGVLREAVRYINKHGIQEEGIFRKSPPFHKLRQVRDAKTCFDEIKDFRLATDAYDVHAIAGLVKLFFLELPEPLLTYELYDDFVLAQDEEDPPRRLHLTRLCIDRLPELNKVVLQLMVRFLGRVTDYAESNGMDADNLAEVFGSMWIRNRSNHVDSDAFLNISGIIAAMIRDYDYLFMPVDMRLPETFASADGSDIGSTSSAGGGGGGGGGSTGMATPPGGGGAPVPFNQRAPPHLRLETRQLGLVGSGIQTPTASPGENDRERNDKLLRLRDIIKITLQEIEVKLRVVEGQVDRAASPEDLMVLGRKIRNLKAILDDD